VFGIVRRKSHSMMAKNEFGQGVEHFKAAATHAARGTGAAVGPTISSAKDRVQPAAAKARDAAATGWGSAVATLAPLAAAATEGARQAGKQTSKASKKSAKKLDRRARKTIGPKKQSSKGRLVGITIAGLAVGAAAAMILRRRQRQQWDEYDPSQPIATGNTGPVGSESISPMAEATLNDAEKDQTASTQHSPTVARMAGGNPPE
jgi:hypothetical protein